MSNAAAVLLKDPTNLVQLVLYGGYGPATEGHPRPFGMPPAVLELQDRDIAAVLTHLRSRCKLLRVVYEERLAALVVPGRAVP